MDILSGGGLGGEPRSPDPITRSMFDGPEHTASAETGVRKPAERNLIH
jgi:hypothetical protein